MFFLNFKAVYLLKWKSNLFICLINCGKNICSDHEVFQDVVAKLRSMFINNGYPNYFFDKVLHQFLNRSANVSQTQLKNKK